MSARPLTVRQWLRTCTWRRKAPIRPICRKRTEWNDKGLQVESGSGPPDHPSAIATWGAALEEEQSVDYSIGMWVGNRGNGRHAE